MVVRCDIEFDNNPLGVYFAGQMLTGRISLIADKPKNVIGVALYIQGFAETSWTESKSKGTSNESETVTYSGHEDYIGSVTYLVGSNVGHTVTIDPGIHTFNYSCHIPIHCPSSFEGVHGHVRYLVKVALIRPWKFDQTFTKGFTVLKMMDLNYDRPILMMPSEVEVQKVFCCGPCSSEPLKITVNIPQTGYVPGQFIPITVNVRNNTSVPIDEMKVSLAMHVCFYSQSPSESTNSSRTTVSKLKGEGVLRQCNKQFTYDLPVPATAPTCFNLCRIIQIAYQIEVEARIKGIMHADQVVCTPVTIGNVPLMGIGGVIQGQPRLSGQGPKMLEGPQEGVGANPVNGTAITPDNPWAANIPPPNYETAVHTIPGKINAHEAHDYGETDFIPRYPVFNVPSPSAPSENLQNAGGFTNFVEDPNKSTWL